jgi:hypothetical protein
MIPDGRFSIGAMLDAGCWMLDNCVSASSRATRASSIEHPVSHSDCSHRMTSPRLPQPGPGID